MELIRKSISKHKLATTLVGVIGTAVILVSVSISVYYRSGAYQLDLSRPEYKSLRSQIDADSKTSDRFESQGEITEEVLDEFLGRYKDKSSRIFEAQAFSNDVLSDQQLGLTD